MSIFNLRNIFGFNRLRPGKVTNSSVTGECHDSIGKNINQRLVEIYGQDQINLQLLYENWSIKDDWRLKDEALSLLLAIDPEKKPDTTDVDQIRINDELWSHAKDCVEQGLLQVINRKQLAEEWRARPVDVYRWAKISRIQVPETLAKLMEFISNTVKQTVTDGHMSEYGVNMDIESVKLGKDRENILGMALAILAAYPEQCQNSKGEVKVENILKLIDEKSHIWPEFRNPDLSVAARRELLEKWLKW